MERRNQRAEGAERSGAPSARGAAAGGIPGAQPARDEAEHLPQSHPTRPGAGRRTVRVDARKPHRTFTPKQRLLILDTWMRSGLPATVFSEICGVGVGTLSKWRSRFEEEGPGGLDDRPRGPGTGSRLPEPTRRAILMLKKSHPEWGSERIHDMLLRSEGFRASPGAIRRLLLDEGYVVEETKKPRHEPRKPRRFERARPNQLWQTDLFTFTLKRENRRVHLVGYLDDHSRFLVGFALSASSSGAMVRGALEDAIANYGAPQEVLTDQGPQYHTWRGKSAFAKLLERRGIKQLVARPRHPQTLGKIERFWGSLWRELVQGAIFRGLDDARSRIGHWIDHYNFFRPHQGLGRGAVPADRFFEAAPEVRRALEERVEENALDFALHGEPRKPMYLTGRVGDRAVTLHAEGERVILQSEDGAREEVDLSAPGRRADGEVRSLLPADEPEQEEADDPSTEEPQAPEGPEPHVPDPEEPESPADLSAEPPPGTSPLDSVLDDLDEGLGR